MTREQRTAIDNPCYLGVEAIQPMYRWRGPDGISTHILTVGAGHGLGDAILGIPDGIPIWHASFRPSNPQLPIAAILHHMLDGVGDPEAEWMHQGNNGVVHLRRLVSHEEELIVGPIRDLRGTAEGFERLRMVAATTGLSLSQLGTIESWALADDQEGRPQESGFDTGRPISHTERHRRWTAIFRGAQNFLGRLRN